MSFVENRKNSSTDTRWAAGLIAVCRDSFQRLRGEGHPGVALDTLNIEESSSALRERARLGSKRFSAALLVTSDMATLDFGAKLAPSDIHSVRRNSIERMNSILKSIRPGDSEELVLNELTQKGFKPDRGYYAASGEIYNYEFDNYATYGGRPVYDVDGQPILCETVSLSFNQSGNLLAVERR